MVSRYRQSAVSAGAIGTFLSVVNVIVGFGFQAALAATLGVDALADVFQVAWTIVTYFAVVQFTMVTSLLVPRLQTVVAGVECVGRSRLPLILGVAASSIQALAAGAIASGDLRLLLLAAAPAHVFVGATAVPQALAYINRRFWIAGVGPIANGIVLLIVTLFGLGHLNAVVLGVAMTLGYVAQWTVTALGTKDLAPFAYRGITITTRFFLGVLGFTLVSKFQPVLERIVSYQLATGTTAALGYGQKIAQGLVLFATFSFATASTASLARHAGARNTLDAADLLARITLATLVFGSVVTALALPAAYPVVVILFERGAFNPDDSQFVANVVIAQLPWVWAGALTGVFSAYLYIEGRYAQVLLASLSGLAVTLLCGLALSTVVPQYAVAIASSAGMVAALLGAVAILSRTDLWHNYLLLLKERWRLTLATIGVVATSGLVFGLLRLIVGVPDFVECVVATLVTAVLAGSILLSSGAARAELAEVLNAKL
jgi:putative peptidoglycan lipid II flippase